MPIYEYCCSDCGHELEALQSVGAPPLRKCPACGKSKLQKKLSAAAFHLKGQGWYKTDFRDQGKKSLSEDKDKSAGKDGATAETSSKPTDNGADKSASERSKTSTDAPAVASAGDASGKSA